MDAGRSGAVIKNLARQFAGGRIVLVDEAFSSAAAGPEKLSALVVFVMPGDVALQILL